MRPNPPGVPRSLRLIVVFLIVGFAGALEAARAADAAQCPPAPKVVGPDGLPGTADDGTIFENFDTERDGVPGISLDSSPRGPGILNDTIGRPVTLTRVRRASLLAATAAPMIVFSAIGAVSTTSGMRLDTSGFKRAGARGKAR